MDWLLLTANGAGVSVDVPCGGVINFVCRSSGHYGDHIVLYKGSNAGGVLARSKLPYDLHYKVSDASSSDTASYTCHDESGYAVDDNVYVSVVSCLDTDVPNPIILWSCLAVVILIIAILASLISYFRMMKKSRGRSTRGADQASATSGTHTTVNHNRTSDHFSLSLPTVSSGDVRQSRWSAVSGRLAGSPPYRTLRAYDVDPPSYGSVVLEDDFPAVAADVTSDSHAPPPYSSVLADQSQRSPNRKADHSDEAMLDPPPAYPGPN
ncbi:unnamed protein product [Lymnaea stagnalis]|uniref:Uncharacterized protein n=1 Tax=Lymnaea stagnalis TaxID=6523 RepID=A0AAV2H0P3_LYMST